MKLSQQMETALNEQMVHEFNNAYAYLGLAATLNGGVFCGFSHWMWVQYEEELTHGKKLYDFIYACGGRAVLDTLPKPDNSNIHTPLQAFEKAYKLELDTTERIHRLYALAEQEGDYRVKEFLHWYIREQVEEEEQVQTWIGKLEFAENDTAALIELDHQARKRD